MNPLLQKLNSDINVIPFDKIQSKHFIPALKESIADAHKQCEQYKKNTTIDFDHVIVELEKLGEPIDYISTIYYALYGADATKEIQEISEEFSSLITKYSNDITLDPEIFQKVKKLYEKKDSLKLTQEQMQIVETYFLDFTRNGALLNEADKNILREIDEKLSSIGLKYSKNILDATNEYELVITNKDDLDGLPETAVEEAKETAKAKGKDHAWVFTLQFPSYLPFVTYSKKANLRKEIFMAYGKRAFGGKFDNQENVLEIIALRDKRAKLLGFKNHADFVLRKRMASEPNKVLSFLDSLLLKALPAAKKEKAQLEKLKKDTEGGELNRWDVSYYSEILKKQELDFDDEVLRPYFKLENVVDGIFKVAKKLYGLDFQEVFDLPKYHADVRTFKVMDKGEYLGVFYTDFFPRETKRGGAWMTSLFDQGLFAGKVRRPHISIVCNFTKPTATKPALLTLDEVLTLFHEFGHALHGLLTKCTYRKLSGTNVYWDFVELPSQIMENWAQEKECLDLFAEHYETKEKIPADLVKKIGKNRVFLEGLGTLRQLGFSFLDMTWHMGDIPKNTDVAAFEKQILKKTDLFQAVNGTCMSTSFSHIFSGGYSAGYYSYKWAEVLDADAFEYFVEKGIFNHNVAMSFKENILEKGGTVHPMELYKKFRGQEPNVDALLRRSGLI
ncbi:MAG: M3 family metallopeptidase [Bacteriovoracaceae bacterium]|nr:M3 family metallopeptidase [Bacteriovoracaceae bacterium]